MTVLLTHLPSDVRRDRLTTEILLSAYVNKLIKINNENDRWSLVSLSNNKGKMPHPYKWSFWTAKSKKVLGRCTMNLELDAIKITRIWRSNASRSSTFDMTHFWLGKLWYNSGRNLELKFVESMRRQFEFSVDRWEFKNCYRMVIKLLFFSFQIVLDSYMKFSSLSNVGMNSSFFPQVEVHSVYGNIVEARCVLSTLFLFLETPFS